MPEPIEITPRGLKSILDDIKKGLLKIPRFQREVVWELADSVALLDSVYRLFPIGSLVIWETWEKLADIRAIGNLELPESPKNQMPSYVLDGQQRLTSLYACAEEAEIHSKKRKTPVKYTAWFDLDKKCFTVAKPEHGVTFKQLIALNYDDYRDPLKKNHKEIFSNARSILLEAYSFSTIVVRERGMEDACTIFERINNSGKKLTVFDLLVAKTYPIKFDLREKWKKLDRELITFSGLNPILPMHALSLLKIKLDPDRTTTDSTDKYGCHKRHLLALEAEDIRDSWLLIKECIKLGVDFISQHIGVPSAKLLPYEASLTLITLFFLLNNKTAPTERQARRLSQYFWSASISGRYGGSPESTMEEDAQTIRAIQKNEKRDLIWAQPIQAQDILDARYDRRDARVQTVLCLLASKRPTSFKSNSPIPIAHAFSQFNIAELHHIFPRSWLKKSGNKQWLEREHSLGNICLSPSREHRNIIGSKPPSEYTSLFRVENDKLAASLASHLIPQSMAQLLKEDRFEEFIRQRAEIIAQELNNAAQVTI